MREAAPHAVKSDVENPRREQGSVFSDPILEINAATAPGASRRSEV